MTHPCETCTRPIADGATFCVRCAHLLDAALADISAYRGLAYDLDLAIARQARIGQRDGGRPSTMPVPFDDRASRAADHLRGVLTSWARLVVDETGADTPADTLTGLATWLRRWVGWLRHHPAGAEAHDQITEAVRAARRICDRRAARWYAGPCDECGAGLYAITGALIVECQPCDLIYDVAARREWLLDALEDHLANATQMSRLVTYLGITLKPNSIRMYASKGRIVSHGHDPNGHPMYRLGDVVRTYYNAGQKAS